MSLQYLSLEGLPAKARIQPPSNDCIPNPKRPSNPFTPSPEPDWVEINKLGSRPEPPPVRGSQRARTVDFNNPHKPTSSASSSTTSLHHPSNPVARKMIVPQYDAKDPAQITYMDGARDLISGLRRNASNSSTRSLPILPNRNLPPVTSLSGPTVPMNSKPQVLRKPAPPPIPNKKPSLLSKTSSPSRTPPPPSYRDDPEPSPRRSMALPSSTVRKPVLNLMDDDFGGAKPPLPPRTGTGLNAGSNGSSRNLLDDEGDMKSLDGWEVLRPDR